jgi:hypothetical protein
VPFAKSIQTASPEASSENLIRLPPDPLCVSV